MIIILNGYQVINRPADRQQNDDGDITIIIQCTMKLSSVLWNGRDHACVIGGVGGHMMILQSTWTGWRWRCTIFVAQMGVAGRAGRALQPSDSFLTLISEICCIHIYIYTLSYLQYIHKYTIHTIYTDIYIPTIYTDIYKYIQLYTSCDAPHEGEVVGITPHHTKYHAKHKMKVQIVIRDNHAKHTMKVQIVIRDNHAKHIAVCFTVCERFMW